MKPKNVSTKKIILGIGDKMPFGKYEGLPLDELAENKPDYILFLNESIDNCNIDEDLLQLAEESLPE